MFIEKQASLWGKKLIEKKDDGSLSVCPVLSECALYYQTLYPVFQIPGHGTFPFPQHGGGAAGSMVSMARSCIHIELVVLAAPNQITEFFFYRLWSGEERKWWSDENL